jgi:hypothetical protein
LLRGREFTPAEEQDANAPPVAVVDEPLARALFPGEDPIGRQVQIASRDDAAPAGGSAIILEGEKRGSQVMEVVGVVAGLRDDLFDKSPVAHLYVPYGRQYRSWMNVHLCLVSGGAVAEAAMMQTVRRELRALDEKLPILGLLTMTEHRDTSDAYWLVKAGAQIFTVFGAVAVFLALVGLYAVKAYVVARRTREIGIRMAIGSTAANVLWLVLKEGLSLTLAGLAVGFAIAVAIGQVVASMLYEVSAFDPVVFALAPLVLAVAALAACYLPARRATRIAPIVALRSE